MQQGLKPLTGALTDSTTVHILCVTDDHQNVGYKQGKDKDETGDRTAAAVGWVMSPSGETSKVLKKVWAYAPKDFVAVARAASGAAAVVVTGAAS